MRKKQLLEQNSELFGRIEKAEATINRLRGELSVRDGKIKGLEAEVERLSAQLNATKPLKELEAKLVRQAEIPKDVEYGASVIGKTVIEATRICNVLTGDSAKDDKKELVNLILGRTEVTKAEILKAVSEEADFEDKKIAIDSQYELALDYFKSIMEQ